MRPYALILIPVFLFCVLAAAMLWKDGEAYPEVRALTGSALSQDEYAAYFKKLAEERGARYAFQVLKKIELPPAMNVHTVAHAVGDVLYAQEGVGGMSACTQDFRNACSHSVVIQAFIEDGSEAVVHIQDACKKAPGGPGAYAICFHGVGHGIMAYLDYDFESAVSRCAAVTSDAGTGTGHRFMSAREECVGGAVMELISGAHDSAAQEKALSVYMPLDNPFRPCTDAYVSDELREACIISLTQRFFGYAGIEEDLPSPEEYSSAVESCRRTEDRTERNACYAGFGKVFVFFATELNGGDATSLPDHALADVWKWCGYAEEDEGVAACVSVAVDSLYWAGQNGERMPARFCSLAPGNTGPRCYVDLTEDIRHFSSIERRSAACASLPEDFRSECVRE